MVCCVPIDLYDGDHYKSVLVRMCIMGAHTNTEYTLVKRKGEKNNTCRDENLSWRNNSN